MLCILESMLDSNSVFTHYHIAFIMNDVIFENNVLTSVV